eukprot:TRINITY_DN66279_c5_g1_i2.p1 TRINITY_DN66279_c5_g1~~TRINITY_DN66279_c5_g1_i2.p1  ORF type:complete len:296 (+),score=139.61 TRINITY_DN66279_c5_g1_i2:171-1058(+)
MPEAGNLRVWHGVIFIRSGRYQQGVFKFVIELIGYPERGPRVMFTSKVFNPLVSNKTGELDLSIQFPKWDRTKHTIVLVLYYIKAVFYKADFWEPRLRHPAFNKSAQNLWKRDKVKFDQKCAASAQESLRKVYVHNPNDSIRFSRHKHEHALVLNRIFREENAAPATTSSSSSATTTSSTATTTPSSSASSTTPNKKHDQETKSDHGAPQTPASRIRPRNDPTIVDEDEERRSKSDYASWFADGVNSLSAYQQKFRTPRRSSHLGVSPMKDSGSNNNSNDDAAADNRIIILLRKH